MLNIEKKVKHKINVHLTDGEVIEVSKSGKTAVVVWGIEEKIHGYKGTRYKVSTLENI